MPSHTTADAAAPLMVSVSGCRGVVGRSFTPELIARFVGAFAEWVARSPHAGDARPQVVLGRDGRAGGQAPAMCAAGALAAAGCDVIDIGVAATPTIGHAVRALRAAAGLGVTASHNPGEWNGLKPITGAGRAPGPDESRAIIQAFHDAEVRLVDAPHAGALRTDPGAARRHTDDVLHAVADLDPDDAIRARRFRVVLDSVNASGAHGGRALLDALGCDLTHLGADASGVFPHPPEPTREHLADLCGRVRDAGADVGFAQDPDADRLAIIDEQGAYIGEEHTLVLAATSLLSALPQEDRQGAVLVANLSTSRMIDDVAARFGARVVRSPVGEANVVDAMTAHAAPLGGEGNGGVIWPRIVPIRDSLGAMALVLSLMARDARPLSAIVADTPAYAIVKRKLDIGHGLAERALDAAKSLHPGADIDDQDGVRVDFNDPDGGRAWLHVRPSNTEPILRLIAEAPTEAAARRALDQIEHALKA